MSRSADLPRDTLLLDLHLPADPGAPAQARHATDSALGDVATTVRQSALLVVSELVTNAVVHAGEPLRLRVRRIRDQLRIELADGCPDVPVRHDPHPTQPSGRGLLLVASLADRWGNAPTPQGKLVWAELAL
jgi:anti-sigma regulatory factor (Ser/Thr protein kinase)